MLRLILVACLMVSVVTSEVFASGRKDPLIAFILSAAVPGGGQFYNEQPQKAVIPIGGLVTFIGLWYLAFEDGDGLTSDPPHYILRYDPDVDDDDYLAAVGLLVFLGTQTYGALDAIISANKINRQRGFGHLMEFDGDRTTLGVDPIASRNKLGTMLTLRF